MRSQFVLRHSCFVISPYLFANKNKDAGGQRDEVEQKNSWPEIYAKP